MEPGDHLATTPDRPAVIMADSGVTVTYAELDERSKRLAQLLSAAGLRTGEHLAVLLENHPRYFEVYWAALRTGLYITPINWHLRAEEVTYIIEDCGASALVTSVAMAGIVNGLGDSLANVSTRLVMDGDIPGFERYEDAIARFPAEALPDEIEGHAMFYSSGTTGRPKGIKPPISGEAFGRTTPPIMALIQNLFGFTSDTIYLSPAPLYHAAPLGWTTAVQRIGGTCVVMERYDAKRTLELIEEHHVTHAQFVPTHFVRMLKLADAERHAHDLSSLQVAVHAAAPCPVPVKEQMIEWWGTKIYEFYAGSEGNGFCFVGPEDWLAHRGTVGKAMWGSIHILDEDGNELPVGEPGQIWFESAATFEYHNDPVKTANAFNDRGWSSLGDVGYLDAEGYLYLTDRISHMIISGGVNIYPQEVENLLTMHPAVADVAVIGVPHAEMGEEVKAVVIASDPAAAGPPLEAELIAYCKEHMATYKCPATVDFVDSLPRLPTGKLLKRELRNRYWP
ncbi:MAG: AMP-binding protein [Acidimicrobiia bacterium]